jgi:hypothetical protein
MIDCRLRSTLYCGLCAVCCVVLGMHLQYDGTMGGVYSLQATVPVEVTRSQKELHFVDHKSTVMIAVHCK